MSDDFFAYISRMRYIGRWSLMRNSLPENIQEHSHMVAVIAHALGVIRRDVLHGDCDPNECAAVALYHDSSEILTGDLPTPIKHNSASMRDEYQKIEEMAVQRLLEMLPEDLRGHYEPLVAADRNAPSWRIVKAADRICAYVKCLEEAKVGNREFAEAQSGIESTIHAIDLPEVKDFMAEFVPGFAMTLDQISR